MKITKAKYNWLVAQYNYRKNKEEIIEISDEEYQRLTGKIVPQDPTGNTEPMNPEQEEFETYTITFKNGYEIVKTVIGASGTYVSAPYVEKEGYKFKGWSIDGTTVTIPVNIISNSNITYIAIWTTQETPIKPQEETYNYAGYDFGVGPFAYNIISLEEQTVSINYIGNKNITEIIIPSSINYNGHKFTIITIGSYAFSNCRRLININIPNSITTIGDNAFEGCEELININIPDSVTIIGDNTIKPNYGVFAGCFKLTNVNIPNGVTKISYGLFSGCNIININIPDSVTKIENYAFSGCKLTNINIPNSVTIIAKYAFASCDNLHNFVTYSSVVFDILTLSSNLLNIYCLPELIEQYAIKYKKEIFLGKINILDINTYTE